MSQLEDEYRRIAAAHKAATRWFTARSCIPASVTRVFAAGTKVVLVPLLAHLPVDELPTLASQAAYRAWFTRQLDLVADEILRLNSPSTRPGIHRATSGATRPRCSRFTSGTSCYSAGTSQTRMFSGSRPGSTARSTAS